MGNTQRLPQTLLESFDVQTGEFDPQLHYLLYDDIEFQLLERTSSGIITRKYKGGWVIVDNGYLP